MISGYDKTKTGKQTVTVTYQGFTDTFEVNVIESNAPTTNPSNPTDSTSSGCSGCNSSLSGDSMVILASVITVLALVFIRLRKKEN